MSGEDNGQNGHGEISPEQREAIRRRSLEIGTKLDAVTARRAPADNAADRRRGAAFGQAFRFAAELVVGVVVGGLIGWALDRQFSTAPWLLVLFVIFGFAAGLLNVIRAAQRAQAANEAGQLATPSVKDDDDND